MSHQLPYGLEQYGIRLRRIATNGIHLNVAEAGDGPLVFLLHGFPECWASWGPQIKFLVDQGYRVVAPEMRGYGDSDAPEDITAYDTVELAADVIGLLDAYDQERGVIIGHDWGCIVAWHTAWLHPERIKGVGGLSVPWFGRGQTDTLSALKRQMGDNYFYIIDFQNAAAHEALNRDKGKSLEAILTGHFDLLGQKAGDQGLLERITMPARRPDYMPQDFLDYITSRYQRHGFEPVLNWYRNFERTWQRTADRDGHTITVPAMYLTGSKDWTNRYADSIGLDMHERCSDLRINEVIKAGHWLGQEEPELVNRKIAEFLALIGH
ncbi:Pimeloyl-ACP methyl ester carboxylesterase [Microbulbifer donghaiensis]|uniref:Pimeloyl-ACP methyl ester carboxylesterase n=1 Tax=Microbulbifer donghaiensis TaxID=494016 RepID=A0A1M4W2K7_9GAMM|nr:alpha/beta hydrolase [Microbulbifer donghaiensis]SHE75501.1 Pimeloyl-ACP methyl ester carboxylesterase [Microbulbifer donghaiensis]